MSMRASAARYAKALLDVALAESDPEQVERDLAAFIGVTERHPDLQRALTNPVVPAKKKRGVVDQVTALTSAAPTVRKLLALLADRDRLALLPELLDVYRERLREHRNVVNAEVTTATALSSEQAEALRQRLMRATGQTVNMTSAVDPSIIGGVVTRIGSTVYDGSVATQLAAMRQRLERRA